MNNITTFLTNEKWVIAIVLVILLFILVDSSSFLSVLENWGVLIIAVAGAYFIMNKGLQSVAK